jgi:hypothetical protein
MLAAVDDLCQNISIAKWSAENASRFTHYRNLKKFPFRQFWD